MDSPRSTFASVSGSAPVLTVNGTPYTLGTAFFSSKTDIGPLPFLGYKSPVKLKSSDNITFNGDQNIYTFTTSSNGTDYNAQIINYQVNNLVGVGPITDPVDGSPKAPCGYQPSQGAYWTPNPCFANAIYTGQGDWKDQNGATSGLSSSGWDANGLPLNATLPTWKMVNLTLNNSYGLNPSAFYTVLKEGKYLLKKSGTCITYLDTDAGANITEDPSSTDDAKIFNVSKITNNTYFSFKVRLDMTGGGTCAAGSLALYDDEIDWGNPQLFHPRFVNQIYKQTFLRLKDFYIIDGGNSIYDLDDFGQYTWGSFGQSAQKYINKVTSITSVNSGNYCQDGVNRMVINFQSNHNYNNGQTITVLVPGVNNVCDSNITLTYSDNSTSVVNVTGICYPISPTSVLINGYTNLNNKPLAYNDLSSKNAFAIVYLQSPPADSGFKLALLCPYLKRLWFSIPITASTACAYSLGEIAAQYLNQMPGVVLNVEVGNECWNGSAGFPQHYHCAVMGLQIATQRAAAGDNSWPTDQWTQSAWGYAAISGTLHNSFKSGFVAGGGNLTQLKLTINAQAFGGWWLSQVLYYAANHDLNYNRPTDPGFTSTFSFDSVGVALYIEVYGANSGINQSEWDSFTVNQANDYCAEWSYNYDYTYFINNYEVTLNSTISASPFPNIEKCSYEGGPQTVYFYGANFTESQNDLKTVSCMYHPDFVLPYLNILNNYSNRGYATLCKLDGAGPIISEGENGVTKRRAYYCYLGRDMRAGVGDGSDGLQNNILELVNSDGTAREPTPDNMCSPIGWAIDHFNSWAVNPQSFSVSPASIPPAGTGTINLNVVGSGTKWNRESTIFNASGVIGFSVVSQVINSPTSASVTVSQSSGTGTLVLTDGISNSNINVQTPKQTIRILSFKRS